MAEYDAFFNDLDEVPQDEEIRIVVRDLTPGRRKYRCQVVRARVSREPTRYPERLWPRLGRGQWVGEPWSIRILEEINPIPEPWR